MDEPMEIAISFLTNPADETAPPLYFWWLAFTDKTGRRWPVWEWDAHCWSEEEVRSEIARAQEVDSQLAQILVSPEVAHRLPHDA